MAISSGTTSSAAGPLDVAKLVSQLIAVESKARLAPLTSKAQQLIALISAYDALRLALVACQQALRQWDSARLLGSGTAAATRVASGYVSAFNTLIMGMAESSRPPPSALSAKGCLPDPLASDTLAQALIGQLRESVLATAGRHADGTLADVGLHFRKDDTLAIDTHHNPGGLAALFCAQDGLLPRTQSLLDQMLGEDGLLAGKTRALQTALKRVAKQQAATLERLDSLRESYTRQFNRLNITLEKMQASHDQPSQPLARRHEP
nr:flagellar filament capping protein FliD [Herbaspirillum sp. ASV7]